MLCCTDIQIEMVETIYVYVEKLDHFSFLSASPLHNGYLLRMFQSHSMPLCKPVPWSQNAFTRKDISRSKASGQPQPP